MNWVINPNRVVREAITARYCPCESHLVDAGTSSLDFNSPLEEQTVVLEPDAIHEYGERLPATEEDMDDIRDARAAFAEIGDRKDYETFRRELGLK